MMGPHQANNGDCYDQMRTTLHNNLASAREEADEWDRLGEGGNRDFWATDWPKQRVKDELKLVRLKQRELNQEFKVARDGAQRLNDAHDALYRYQGHVTGLRMKIGRSGKNAIPQQPKHEMDQKPKFQKSKTTPPMNGAGQFEQSMRLGSIEPKIGQIQRAGTVPFNIYNHQNQNIDSTRLFPGRYVQ
eukprot:Selendium_serpulae@DN8036_c0_g1_i1.p1